MNDPRVTASEITAATGTVRLTAAQALVRYLAALRTQTGLADVGTAPLFGGVFAIFGHGNVAGVGEALYRHRRELPTYRAHNEQAMAHAAIAYAKAHFRRRMMACTTSIGPGATNLLTAAALAHVDRLPVLFLPGDIFISRAPDPALCGPVTLALPQDVQTLAHDFPEDFFAPAAVAFRALPPAEADVERAAG